jgi:hypothetical protein
MSLGLTLVGLAWSGLAQPVGAIGPAGLLDSASATPTLAPDGAGVTLYLPPDPPTATLQVVCGLPGDSGWCRMPVQVTMLGNAAGSPIARLDYRLDGQALSTAKDAFVMEDGQNGTHSLSLVAVDFLGRISDPVSQAYRVDRSLPTAVFTGSNATGLTFNIADEGAGVAAWTVQIFDRDGQSVFYYEGSGPFEGVLPWIAAPDIYQVEVFARDSAGNEAHLPRTAFAIATPTPASVFQQVLGLFLPKPIATIAVSTPTVTAVPKTPSPTAVPTPTSAMTAVPSPASPLPTPAPVEVRPDIQSPLSNIRPKMGLGWFALATLLTALIGWAIATALDRRPSALHALATELTGLRWRHEAAGLRQVASRSSNTPFPDTQSAGGLNL